MNFPDVYQAKIIADSVNPHGCRMTTMLWTYPRFIHAEIMTHRMLSKNSSSSRFMPVSYLVDKVIKTPALPVYWGSDKKGMIAGEELTGQDLELAQDEWIDARILMLQKAESLKKIGLYRGLANRLLEPWMPITIVISGTNGWTNLFALRCHPDAQHEFQRVANMAREAQKVSVPRLLKPGEWHLPFIDEETQDGIRYFIDEEGIINNYDMQSMYLDIAKQCSVARCARASRYSAEGETTIERDLKSYQRLIESRPVHASPFEHIAQSLDDINWYRNLRGFKPFRCDVPYDYVEDELYEGPTQ